MFLNLPECAGGGSTWGVEYSDEDEFTLTGMYCPVCPGRYWDKPQDFGLSTAEPAYIEEDVVCVGKGSDFVSEELELDRCLKQGKKLLGF